MYRIIASHLFSNLMQADIHLRGMQYEMSKV